MSEIVIITGLSKRGEGLASALCGAITVPYCLPGEQVDIELIQTKDKNWGQIRRIENDSSSRAEPICQHYGTCGGCLLQHFNGQSYADFKKTQVTSALENYGLDSTCVEAPIIIGPHQRRRVDFLARKFPDEFAMGYYQLNSRRRIDLKECAIVDPLIEKLFGPLKIVLEQILEMRELVHIFILRAENGLDVLLAGFKRTLSQEQQHILEKFAKAQNLTRLCYKIKRQTHLLHQTEQPYVSFAGYHMDVNPNVFLQASQKADQILSQMVVAALPKLATKIVDLYCGRGTLSLPILASGRYVDGFEGDKHAIAALNNLNEPGLNAQVRDLFENPLTADELKRYNAVVMNPPRSGVKGQIPHIIESQIETVIYVSCNPETFAKDMAELCQSEYRLESVIPVDQFMWSHHVEVVGIAKKCF